MLRVALLTETVVVIPTVTAVGKVMAQQRLTL